MILSALPDTCVVATHADQTKGPLEVKLPHGESVYVYSGHVRGPVSVDHAIQACKNKNQVIILPDNKKTAKFQYGQEVTHVEYSSYGDKLKFYVYQKTIGKENWRTIDRFYVNQKSY